MNKVYIVKEVHDYKKHLIGVCPNRELAEKLKNQNEKLWDIEDCEITSEMWNEMLSQVYNNKGIPTGQSLEEIMIETYPEYSVSDITKACVIYMNRSYVNTTIEEINLYTSDSDIILYGINSRTSTCR